MHILLIKLINLEIKEKINSFVENLEVACLRNIYT